MKEMLQKLREASVDAILQADDITALENLRVKYLGKTGCEKRKMNRIDNNLCSC